MNELEALENAVKSTGLTNLSVLEWYFNDKRKTVKMYFLQFGNSTISPTLDYENMNHFILGVSKGLKIGKGISV